MAETQGQGSQAAAVKADDKAAAERVKSGKTVKVDIHRRNIIHSRGTAYGPGKDIEIPAAVAERHGLQGKKAERKRAKAAKRASRRTAGRSRRSS